MSTLINRIQRAFLGSAGPEKVRALLTELAIPAGGSSENALREARRGFLRPISDEAILRDALSGLGLTGGGTGARPITRIRAAILHNLVDSETTLRDGLNDLLAADDLGGGGSAAPEWVPEGAKIHIDFVGGDPQGRAWVEGTGEVAVNTLLGTDANAEEYYGDTYYEEEGLGPDGYEYSNTPSGYPFALIGAARDALFDAGGATFTVRFKSSADASKPMYLMSADGNNSIDIELNASSGNLSASTGAQVTGVTNTGPGAVNVVAVTFVPGSRLDLAANGSSTDSDLFAPPATPLVAFVIDASADAIQSIAIYDPLPTTDGLSELSDLGDGGGGSSLPPTDIALSAATVAEDAALGHVIGVLSATDADTDDAITFTLTDDASGRFGISGSNLIVTGVLDYETAITHNITVRATDEAAHTYDEVFAITVTDVAETPPEDPPPDGDPEDDDTFVWTPTITEVDGGIKISGKKDPSAGKFIYDLGPAVAGMTYTMEYDPDFSLMTNQGKNTAVGFIWKDGNDFHFIGNQGDGSTGLDAKQISGDDKWNSGVGWTEDNAGAVANGTQAGPNFIRLVISEDGATYAYQTSPDIDGPWTDEYTDELPTPHADATSPPQFGIGVIFRATDTGSFSIKITRWIATAAMVWATWDVATASNVTLSGGDLVATNTGTGTNHGVKIASGSGKTIEKYYFEATFTTAGGTGMGGNAGVGVCTTASDYTGMGNNATTGSEVFWSAGTVYSNGSNAGVAIGAGTAGTVYGLAIDLDNRKFWCRKPPSGNWNNSGTANPATNTGGVTIPAGTMVPILTFGGGLQAPNNVVTTNFGASAFTGAVPSGYTLGWPA